MDCEIRHPAGKKFEVAFTDSCPGVGSQRRVTNEPPLGPRGEQRWTGHATVLMSGCDVWAVTQVALPHDTDLLGKAAMLPGGDGIRRGTVTGRV